MDRRNTGGIITAIFKPAQRIHQTRSHRLSTNDPNNSAHAKNLSINQLDASPRRLLHLRNRRIRHFRYRRVTRRNLYFAGFLAAFIASARSRMSVARSGFTSCLARPNAKASAGTFSVMTLPDAT
ncbi:hypothetical protein D3C80_540030 [compost metagenome]